MKPRYCRGFFMVHDFGVCAAALSGICFLKLFVGFSFLKKTKYISGNY